VIGYEHKAKVLKNIPATNYGISKLTFSWFVMDSYAVSCKCFGD